MGFIYSSRLGMEHRNFMVTVVDIKLVLPHVYSPLCLQVLFFFSSPLCRSLSICMLCLNALARSICILYEMSNCGLYKIFGEFAFKIFNFEEVSELGVFIAIHRFGTKIFTHSLVHNIIQAFYIHNIMKVLTESRIELNFLI